ncbi:MAG TPA: transglutaminase-like domain-containing protein [Longimicrobiales bacterium]
MTTPAPASARERFAEAVARPEPEIDLASAALLIAAEEYPQLTPEPYLQRLDVLAERVRDRLADENAPLIVLQELSRVLFEEEHFRGNAGNYYDPRNSFLNDVLDRRLGIPLTLCIVYLEVGWRLGLPLAGVNFPGHFVVRYEGEALRLLADPYQEGAIRFEEDAQGLLDQVAGGQLELQATHLRSADRRDILVRLLTNLKSIYLNARDDVKALGAMERILIIRPDAADEVRDHALALTRLGRGAEAMHGLQEYLRLAPDATDRMRIQLLLEHLAQSGR